MAYYMNPGGITMAHRIKLLAGPEEGEKLEFVERYAKALRKDYPDLETHSVYGFDGDGSELDGLLSMPSLFSSHRLVILKHFEDEKKNPNLVKVLDSYIKSPQEDVDLLILSNLLPSALPSGITKQLKDKEDTIIFYELFENKKEDWIRQHFSHEGMRIGRDALLLLLDLVENNTLELKAYSDQIISYMLAKGEKTVTEDDIRSYLSFTKTVDGYTLFEFVANKDLEGALRASAKMLSSSSGSEMQITSVLSKQFRLLESFLWLRGSMSEEEAFKNASSFPVSGYEHKGIGFRSKDTFRKAARNYSANDAKRIIELLDRADVEIRQMSNEMKKTCVDLLLNTIISHGGKEGGIKLQRELMENPFGNL